MSVHRLWAQTCLQTGRNFRRSASRLSRKWHRTEISSTNTYPIYMKLHRILPLNNPHRMRLSSMKSAIYSWRYSSLSVADSDPHGQFSPFRCYDLHRRFVLTEVVFLFILQCPCDFGTTFRIFLSNVTDYELRNSHILTGLTRRANSIDLIFEFGLGWVRSTAPTRTRVRTWTPWSTVATSSSCGVSSTTSTTTIIGVSTSSLISWHPYHGKLSTTG